MSLPATESLSPTARLWAPPPKLSVGQWANDYLHLSPEDSAEPGRYSTDRAPYQLGILEAISDPANQTVVLMTSAQIGKTSVLKAILGYHIHQDPAPILLLQPTLEMAETFSKDRLAPMVRDTPALRGRIKDARSRDSGNTLLHKSFPGGHITMAGANSPASLASRPIRVVLADEVDRYPASAGTEGDPVNLARKRTTTFWNRKIVLTSTPTIKDVSRIEAAFAESDQRHYYVPCPHCGQMDTLKWPHVKWPEGRPKDAYYACPHCGGVIHDADKPQMLAAGQWRAHAQFAGVAGFHIWEAYSPWVSFAKIAEDFLSAKRSPETLKTWVNTSLGETWEDQAGERIVGETLRSRAEPYPILTVPRGAGIVTAGVDVQDNRLAVSLWAWGPGEEAWLVYWGELFGDPAQDALWHELDALLARPLAREDGNEMMVLAAAVDSGGHHTQAVYDYCRQRASRHVLAIKGMSTPGKPPIGRPSVLDVNHRGKTIKRGVQLWPVGADTVKGTLYARLRIADPGPGYVHFPIGIDGEFYEQLTAEKLVTRYHKGFPRREWVLRDGARNEALDCFVYAYAAAHYAGITRIDWDKLLDGRAPPQPKTTESPAKSGVFLSRQRPGFVKSW